MCFTALQQAPVHSDYKQPTVCAPEFISMCTFMFLSAHTHNFLTTDLANFSKKKRKKREKKRKNLCKDPIYLMMLQLVYILS